MIHAMRKKSTVITFNTYKCPLLNLDRGGIQNYRGPKKVPSAPTEK